MLLLATANPELEAYIQENVPNVNHKTYSHLEELQTIDLSYIDVCLLSLYFPSVSHEEEVAKSFLFTIHHLLSKGVRVILLGSSDQIHLFEAAFKIGVWDLVISETGELSGQEILHAIENPKTKEIAEIILEHYKKEKLVEEPMNKRDRKPWSFKMNDQLKQTDNKRLENQVSNEKVMMDEPLPSYKTEMNLQKTFKTKVKLVSFWGITPGLGKRTLSQSLAKVISNRGYRVLYLELDYENAAFSITTGLSHEEKNLLNMVLALNGDEEFDIQNFIAIPEDFIKKGRNEKSIEKIGFHFSVFADSFQKDQFPSISDPKTFVDRFITRVKDLPYDAIILNLPNPLESIFAFPIMLKSDAIVNVITLNPARIKKYQEIRKVISTTPIDSNKWFTVVNQYAVNDLSKDTIDQVLGENTLLVVPNDATRAEHELNLMIGGVMIDRDMGLLADHFGFKAETSENKRKLSFLFGKRGGN